MRTQTRMLSVLAAAFLVVSSAHADSDGQATFGAQWWTQTTNEAKFQEFREVPRGGFLESFMMRQWQDNGGWAGSVWGSNALKSDQSTGMMLGKGVTWRFDGEYTQLPHVWSNITRSPYTEVSPGVFLLPDSLQRTNQEYPGSYLNTMRDLLAVASPAPLSVRTDVTKARLRARPAKGWDFELSSTERQRSGRMAYGASLGFSTAIELPTPISQKMLDADATGQYQKGNMRVKASVGMSRFENNVSTLVWDNPKRYQDRTGGDGPKQGQIDLWPDNRVVRGLFAVGINLPRSSTFSATYHMSQAEQDDQFLPFTTNSTIAQRSLDSLPAQKLDGKVVMFTQDYRLSTHPMERVHGALHVSSENEDNKTPELTFIGFSPYDAGWTATPKTNKLFGADKLEVGADLDFELANWANLTLEAEHETRKHHHREIPEDAELTLGGSLRLVPTDDLQFSAGFKRASRTSDEFLIEDYENAIGQLIEPAGLRRFDIADRDQDIANGSLDYSIGSKIETSIEYNYVKSDYTESLYGLQAAEDHLVVAEATIKATPQLSITGGYGFGQSDTRQQSNQSGVSPSLYAPVNDWWANLRDRTVNIYSRSEWWVRPRKMMLSADYTFTRSLARYDLSNATYTAVSLAPTIYRRHDLELEARWRLRFDLDLAGRYGFDEYDVEDFAATDVPLAGIASGSLASIYLGDSAQDYIAHRLAVVVSRRF